MIYIRTDMNSVIATGHIMRCLSIADAAKQSGENTTFLLADEQALKLVQKRGHHAIVLHTKWDDMDNELPKLLKIIEKYEIEKLLIDSYQVTEKYLATLTLHIKTLYIDDRNAFLYPVNGLVCYANYWEKFDYPGKYKETKLFLGLEYVPLRQVFQNCGEKKIQKRVEELLLLSGGTDPSGMLENILQKLDKSKYKKINVICGKYDTKCPHLQNEYHSFTNIHICQTVANIENFMKAADIAVSAGGTTLYELCACSTPSISYSFADNQLENVRQFQMDGIIDYAGDARYDNPAEKIIDYLEIYENNEYLRKLRSKKMHSLVDGNGACRIVKALKSL